MPKNLIGSFYVDSNRTLSFNTYRSDTVKKGTNRLRVEFEDSQIVSASEITQRDDVDFSSVINDEIFFTVLGKNLYLEVGTESFEGTHVYADAIAPILISGGGTTIFSEPVPPTIKKSNYFFTEIEGSFQYSSSDYICDDNISFNVIDTYSYATPLGTVEIEPIPFWN